MMKSAEDRRMVMSGLGFEDITKPVDGKNLHWACDKNVEMPVKLRASGPGSEAPQTIPEMFYGITQKYKNRPALHVERGGKKICFTFE